jgi:hypothetical protein
MFFFAGVAIAVTVGAEAPPGEINWNAIWVGLGAIPVGFWILFKRM